MLSKKLRLDQPVGTVRVKDWSIFETIGRDLNSDFRSACKRVLYGSVPALCFGSVLIFFRKRFIISRQFEMGKAASYGQASKSSNPQGLFPSRPQ